MLAVATMKAPAIYKSQYPIQSLMLGRYSLRSGGKYRIIEQDGVGGPRLKDRSVALGTRKQLDDLTLRMRVTAGHRA
jgi:hypothetical protein